MQKKINIKRLLPPVIWAGFIFYLSSIPSLKSSFGIWDLYLRKTAHITEFFVLTVLIFPNFSRNTVSARLAAVFIAILYAVSDEFHQSFVTGRFMAFSDMAWDWIGCSVGYLVMSGKDKK